MIHKNDRITINAVPLLIDWDEVDMGGVFMPAVVTVRPEGFPYLNMAPQMNKADLETIEEMLYAKCGLSENKKKFMGSRAEVSMDTLERSW